MNDVMGNGFFAVGAICMYMESSCFPSAAAAAVAKVIYRVDKIYHTIIDAHLFLTVDSQRVRICCMDVEKMKCHPVKCVRYPQKKAENISVNGSL